MVGAVVLFIFQGKDISANLLAIVVCRHDLIFHFGFLFFFFFKFHFEIPAFNYTPRYRCFFFFIDSSFPPDVGKWGRLTYYVCAIIPLFLFLSLRPSSHAFLTKLTPDMGRRRRKRSRRTHDDRLLCVLHAARAPFKKQQSSPLAKRASLLSVTYTYNSTWCVCVCYWGHTGSSFSSIYFVALSVRVCVCVFKGNFELRRSFPTM